MKRSGKMMVAVAALAVAAGGTLSTGGAAVADSSEPQIWEATYDASDDVTPPAALIDENGEAPTEWGVVAIADGSADNDVEKVKKVGGGTWSYGTAAGLDKLQGKKCYSNYHHPSKKHSATAVLSSDVQKTIKEPDIWAKAAAYGGTRWTCYTYWGLYK